MPSKPISFGAYFRSKRKLLGLTLREFCRRNGLDPGNISRLERGLISPPQSAEVLDEYADALRFLTGTADRQLFLDLAAAETGRIPAHITKDPSAVEQLHSVFQSLRSDIRRERAWTNAIDLQNWANYQAARADLPRLVRRLIHADNQTIEKIELTAGEGIGRPGYDGLVIATTSSPNVPSGLSIWEMGVSNDPTRKAASDLRKRSEKPLGINSSESTFIFVTPRRWESKENWCDKARANGRWKDVRVYDADNLEAWLERAPAVDGWFARLIGRRPVGILDIEGHWSNLSQLSDPNLHPEVFLASRAEEIESLEQWLQQPPSSLAYQVNTPAEVIDFFAAYVASLSSEKREAIAARILIVERHEAWEALVDGPQKLVLLPKPELSLEPEQVARAIRMGHHVLVSANRFAGTGFRTAKLSRPIRYELEQALVDSGFEEPKAGQIARECGGSLTVLKRRLPKHPGTVIPKWAGADCAQRLAPFILIGGWDDSSVHDRETVEQITGRSYADAFSDVHFWANNEDSPFVRSLSCWSLTSHEDAWYLLAPYLREDQLHTFEEAAIRVLTAPDPALDLSADERWMSGISGAKRRYSTALRTGISEAIALLAIRSESRIKDVCSPSLWADRIIRGVFKDASDWRLWASLASNLPVLAEASPDSFLDALLADVRRESPHVRKLFESGKGHPLLSRCLHAGLLWALETLAWSPDYLPKVVHALAGLTEIDTGKNQWANRPRTSLVQIFLPWLPQTSANVEQRLAVLEKLRNKHPNVAWDLLLHLLPSRMMTSDPMPRPTWREWALSWSRGATNAEYWSVVDACSGWLLELATGDPKRWVDLIEGMSNLPETWRSQFIQMLSRIDVRPLAVDEQRRVAEALRKVAALHGRHPDADWSFTQSEINQLKTAINRFESENPIVHNAWLFERWSGRLDDEYDGSDESDEKLALRRQKALADLMAINGLPLILEFSKTVELPGVVGYELGRAGILDSEKSVIPDLLDLSPNPEAVFATGYASGCFEVRGWDWVDTLPLRQWNPDQSVALLLALPRAKRTWEIIEELDPTTAQRYWENVSLYVIRDESEIPYAIAMLLKFGRPYSAISVLATALHRKYVPSSSLVMDVLSGGIRRREEIKTTTEKPHDDVRHDIQELISYLQREDTASDNKRLASLEWAYLSVLDGHGGSPVTLHDEMKRRPEFYAEVLELIFRPENDSDEPRGEITDEERDRANNAYRLLHSWTELPGFNASTRIVDADTLEKWIADARAICKKTGRLAVCDSRLGDLLSHAPEEVDGTWPCIPVRDVIDEVGTEEIREGFSIGVMNQRGVYSKSPFEGGTQERELAEKYSRWAAACNAEWPLTADALRNIARHYQHSAQREDEVAEGRRRR